MWVKLGHSLSKAGGIMTLKKIALAFLGLLLMLQSTTVQAQEARRRWEIMNQIRLDKFDIILPKVMRENKIA